MLAALEKSLGIVYSACKSVGINRKTHYDWLKKDAKYAAAVADIEEMSLDFTESKLFKKIQDEDITAIIWHLKTKGKKRGYVEKQEIDTNLSGSVNLIFEETPDCDPINDTDEN